MRWRHKESGLGRHGKHMETGGDLPTPAAVLGCARRRQIGLAQLPHTSAPLLRIQETNS